MVTVPTFTVFSSFWTPKALHTHAHTHTWTAPSKSTDRLSLSSMSELVSVQSDSGRADPRTMITWPGGAEVVQRLCLLLTDCMFMLKNCDSLIFELGDYFITQDLHAEQSCESLLRVDGFSPHFFIFSLTVSFYLLTGPHCGRLPTASCPQNTCFGMQLSGMRMA